MQTTQRIHVGIFLFNQVEVLDFAGPYEVFATTMVGGDYAFKVTTISESGGVIQSHRGLKIYAEEGFDTVTDLDILIIPGGYGADETEIKNPNVISWLRLQKRKVKILASVCTGAFLLAKAGLLDNRRATTHRMDVERLAKTYPQIEVVSDVRFVDEGDIITSAGIAAGMDLSLYIVQKLMGTPIARNTAARMEYPFQF